MMLDVVGDINTPGPPDPGQIDSISRVPYKIGYSFRNPQIVKPVTSRKERPYFAMDWAVKGPSQTKAELFKSGTLQRYPSVWRRAAKSMTIEKLGPDVLGRKEVPNFQEMGLGDVPGPTDNETTTSSVVRDIMGFLQNGIKTVGPMIAQGQDLEAARIKAQAAAQPMTFLPGGLSFPDTGIGVMGWTAIMGAIGVGAFLYFKK